MAEPHRNQSEETLRELLSDSAWLRSLGRALTHQGPEADDLAQHARLAVLQHAPKDLDRKGLRQWIAAVMRNRVRTEAVRRHRRPIGSLDGGEPSRSLPPDRIAELAELQEHVSALVRGLRTEVRDVVLLRYHEVLSGSEIARRLGVPEGTVRWRLKSGLDAVREGLDELHGGRRDSWHGALGLACVSRGAAGALQRSNAGSLAAFSSAKLALGTVAALAVVLAVFWIQRTPEGSLMPVPISREATRDASADLAELPTERQRTLETAAADPSTSMTDLDLPTAAVAIEASLRLTAVDPDGSPLSGAKVQIR